MTKIESSHVLIFCPFPAAYISICQSRLYLDDGDGDEDTMCWDQIILTIEISGVGDACRRASLAPVKRALHYGGFSTDIKPLIPPPSTVHISILRPHPRSRMNNECRESSAIGYLFMCCVS